MSPGHPDPPSPATLLEQISTRWPLISDPVQFVLRYAPPIRRYIGAIVRDPHDADEAAQDFLMRAMEKGFDQQRITRGRFRDYLKAAVRNAAISRLRKKSPASADDVTLANVAAPEAEMSPAEQQWIADWRQCMLERVWQAVELHERRNEGNLFHSALRLTVDRPEDDSTALAAELSIRLKRAIQPEAFRKQLSRARKHFATLLLDEVRQTLENPSKDAVMQELNDLGLTPYIKQYLRA